MGGETVAGVESLTAAGAGVAAVALFVGILLVPVELVLEVAVRGERARWRVDLAVARLGVVRRRGGAKAEEVAAWALSHLQGRREAGGGRGAGLAARWVDGILRADADRWARLAGRVARRGRLVEARITGELGTGDAAVTALLAGAAKAAAAALPGVAEDVLPAFGGRRLSLQVRCIWRARVGDLILAGLGF